MKYYEIMKKRILSIKKAEIILKIIKLKIEIQ